MPKLSFIEEIALEQTKGYYSDNDNAELIIVFNRIPTRSDKKHIAEIFKEHVESLDHAQYGIKPSPWGPFLVYPLDEPLLGYMVREYYRTNGVVVRHMLPCPEHNIFYLFALKLLR